MPESPSSSTKTVSKESARIKSMFAGISRRYDLLNHLLSLNIDKRWRKRTVRELEVQPHEHVLDVCTGTADLALELCGSVSKDAGGKVVGSDFCEEMVQIGEEKRLKRGEDRLTLLVADTLHLPFEDASFDVVTVAFGIRNVCDLDAGIAEMRRVLRPGGRAAILEFTTPRFAPFRGIYHVYFHHVLPRIGRWISGGSKNGGGENGDAENGADAYSYLPKSVGEFPRPDELSEHMRRAGFDEVRHRLLTGGIAALHIGKVNGPREEAGESST